MFMKNKRGVELLGKNLVSLIIFVIGLALIITAISLYLKYYYGDLTNEKASSSLEFFLNKVEEIGPEETKLVTITSPIGWTLNYFSETENINTNGFKKPDSFFSREAICICEKNECIAVACEIPKKPFMNKGTSISIPIEVMDLEITNNPNNYDVKKVE